ncbi:MAG: DUF305 domain-containing protein [Gemmatimonadota bacterium]
MATEGHDGSGGGETGHGSYLRFFVMIATAMIAMYLLTYVNSYRILDHARFSETRLFMTLVMGASMMAIMLVFMLKMYRNRTRNAAIFVGAGLLLAVGIWLVRSQATVGDVDYMEGMIPHHSIAILTSERAGIEDPRVRELADEIIEAQRREIREMDWLIADIRANGVAGSRAEADARPVPDFSGEPE